MRVRTVALSAALLALALFTALNWNVLLVNTTLSVGVADVQAPLGLTLLAIMAGVIGMFLVYILLQQATVRVEARRMAKDLQAQRELADRAEASRFTELRAALDAEMRRMEAVVSAGTRELCEQLQDLEKRLTQGLDESKRGLSACVGEVDDKLDRMWQSRPA